jgi:hypothetical protein
MHNDGYLGTPVPVSIHAGTRAGTRANKNHIGTNKNHTGAMSSTTSVSIC